MFTSLDHIIIGVRDLEQAAGLFGQKLGLLPSGGGIHPVGGTSNRIIVIGDTYLELITVHRPEEAQASIRRRLEVGEGYLNCVFSSDDLAADTQAVRARGVALIGPVAGHLQSADGRERAWRRADIERPDLTQRYPFIIQHESTGEERRFQLAGWSSPPLHPLGAVKVRSVTLAVQDLAEASQRFTQIYGWQTWESFSTESEGLGAQVVSYSLGRSGQTFELAAPTPEDRGSRALQDHLERFGESVYRITLLVSSLLLARRYLDEHAVPSTLIEGPRPALWIDARSSCGAPIVLQQGA